MTFEKIVFIFFLLYLIDIAQGNTCSAPSVKNLVLETLNGKIQGKCSKFLLPEFGNRDVLTWKSIPFAEPPVNENRFKAPVTVKNWSNIRNGTVGPKACLQSGNEDSSEDCLYLNIWVAADSINNRETSQKPILVFIHGVSL